MTFTPKTLAKPVLLAMLSWSGIGQAQEAANGFEMPLTVSGAAFVTQRTTEPPRAGSAFTPSARAVVYPTLRLNTHWVASGAVQFHSRPYFFDEFQSDQTQPKVHLLQGYVGYERFWGRNFVSVRVGQLSSAFGSFLLRYDDAVNPLLDIPLAYGYYYTSPVTNLGLLGAQVDATIDNLDLRAQFTTSSPTNRRTIRQDGHYGTWTGGIGYTIRQGFRVGVSVYRGPYMDREFPWLLPGERDPKALPASGYGAEAEFARGHWNIRGELHRFQKAYTVIPTFNQLTGYGEVKYTFHPRWYGAARVQHFRDDRPYRREVYEFAVGYRPNRFQLLKIGYQIAHRRSYLDPLANVFGVQLVTTLNPISIAWH